MALAAIAAGVIADVVASARDVLRVETGEDALLGRLAQTAVLLCEAFVGAAIVARADGDPPQDWDTVPAPIAQGVAMLVAHLFDHRESDVAPPAAVAALWRPYRRMRLGVGVQPGALA
ncbi:head-tail connector protein [Sphingomonas sp. ZB1N12]|jgi:hypothetical protein|uniref:head-tail connector protein n=1 Tax=Sphingomonas arabinosi TaxID=3096160 RepID=UPI002FC6D39E